MNGLDDEEEHDIDYNYEDDQLGSCDDRNLTMILKRRICSI